MRSIADIGYDGEWQLCNTRWFLPQNRERIYFVGHIRGECRPKVFPIGESSNNVEEKRKGFKSGLWVQSIDSNYYKGADGKRTMIDTGLNQIGTIGKDSEATRVYDTTCARTIKDGGGMGAKTGLYRVDDVNLIAKKRKHDTPKEINAYLKKYKDRTIPKIAKELDLPKTQVEHYFREDKYRTIPSPEIWLQLKDLLGFDDTYDKQVTEIYEKEYEFESAKRVYDASGIAQTIDTAKTGLYKVKSAAIRGRDDNPSGNLEIRDDDVANCILADTNSSMVYNKSNIRRLTPTECERLQGFPDGWTDGQSDTQRYKQCGNAVSVPVVKAIMEKLYET